jgi:AAA domain
MKSRAPITEEERKIALAAFGKQPSTSLFTLYDDVEDSESKSWLVNKMLGAGEMSAWYGPPGCGKGVIIEDMALHIAAGQEWHGRSITRGAVVYIALERKKLVRRRLIAFRRKYGLRGLPFAIVGAVYDFRQAATADQIVEICDQVKRKTGQSIVLIVIDTVSRALAGGDENSPKDMGALIMTSGLIQEKCTDAHVLWVHHIPHDSDRLRGHGALLGAVDTSVSVSSSGTVRKAKVVKANDSEEGEGVSFTIDSVQIADDGTTAPIAVPADPAIAGATTTNRKMPARAKISLDALTETLLNHGTPAPQSLGLPTNTNVVTLNQWHDELCSRSVLERDDKNHWRDFGRIRDQLAARQVIGVRDGMAWQAC